MTALTPEDFTAYKRMLRNDPEAKALMRALSPALTKTAWMAALQALEDGYSSRRAAIKGEMDTAMGRAMSNALALKLEKAWMQNRARGL